MLNLNRYAKLPDLSPVVNQTSADSDSDTTSVIDEVQLSEDKFKHAQKRNLASYRLDYNQLEYVFGHTVLPSSTVERPIHTRSKSFDSVFQTRKPLKVFLCPRVGPLFAFRPVKVQEICSSSRTDTGRASWGRFRSDLRPLADICVACGTTTIYK